MPENDITKTFNRLTQRAGELVNKNDKTPYSTHTTDLLQRVDQLKPCLSRLISASEEFADVNRLSKVVDVLANDKEICTSTDKLANALEEAATKSKSAAPQFSKVLDEAVVLHRHLAAARRSFDDEVNKKFIEILKNFANNDLVEAQKAKKKLEDCRLDLDSSKSKLKSAKSDEQKNRWGNEFRQNEQTFNQVQSESDAIFEKTLTAFNQLNAHFVSLIQSEKKYFETCAKECGLALKE